jgi:predicted metal-dependent phosphoesterase TrpH
VSSHTAVLPGTADLQIHTRFSDGSDSPRDVLRWAERKRLDVIAITDHDTIEGALIAGELALESRSYPDVIVGEEVSSVDGHILGLFLHTRVPPGLSAEETVAAIHEQGGIAIAAHPYWRHASSGRRGWVYSVGDHVEHVAFDAVEVLNGGFTPSMIAANRRAAEVARALGKTEVGGSDAHVRHAVAWAHTRFDGRYARDLRRSILAGSTRAGRSRLELAGLQRYAFWSIGRLRPQPVAG